MFIDFLLEVFRQYSNEPVLIWRDQVYTYQWLQERLDTWRNFIQQRHIRPGTVVVLEADFSPSAVALFLALVEHRCILVPLTSSVEAKKAEFIKIAQSEVSFIVKADDSVDVELLPHKADHEFYRQLDQQGHPGLVLFSSGSTGQSKAAVHDLLGLLEKFRVRKRRFSTLTFLLYDHIGGVNTMLYTLSNGGCMVTVEQRTPDQVLQAIEQHQVDLLPTSPTFINLILLSEAYQRYNLNSLKMVTYGTEPMPESTLKRFHQALPHIELQQTYGLSEVGILRSKSKTSDSLWVKIGGEGFETRVIDGLLQIKARSAMLGYLNAPSPFTPDGWFNTGDAVEVDGDYFRILGRKTEIINVGGEKVYPAEVEDVLSQLDNVEEVVVRGEPHPLTGQVAAAYLKLANPEPLPELRRRLRQFCQTRLASYKIPARIEVVTTLPYSSRFKKQRLISPAEGPHP